MGKVHRQPGGCRMPCRMTARAGLHAPLAPPPGGVAVSLPGVNLPQGAHREYPARDARLIGRETMIEARRSP